MGDGVWRLRVVVHPLTITSVVLLAVNDHLLKQRWPGLLTGKLSDVAGVWLVGALAVAALGSVRWGTALTALCFAALKTSTAVAVLVAPLLGGVTRRDPTDLVALLVLWPLGVLAQRLGARRAARVNDGWATIGAVFVVLGAVFATSATSCDVAPDVGDMALTEDGDVLAQYGEHGVGFGGGDWYLVTADGARQKSAAVPVGVIARQACIDDECFRVVPDEGVYQGDTLIFEYTAERKALLDERMKCAQEPAFGSIVAVEEPDGVHLWVSAGVSGVLHRDAEGVWHEVTVGDAKPPGELAASVTSMVVWIVPILVAVGVGVALPLMNRRLPTRQRTVLVAAAVSLNLAWAAVSYTFEASIDDTFPPLVGLAFYFVWWGIPMALLQSVWILPLVKWVRAASAPPPMYGTG